MRTWLIGQERWVLPQGGAVMGILNVTPDSFSDGGSHAGADEALAHAERLMEEGADVIDVGGESTRPGADPVPEEVEVARVVPVIREMRRRWRVRISVDTRHTAVARAALEAGADIVNDVEGLCGEGMAALCAEYGCGVVVMHMQGEPGTMQVAPRYDDVVGEVRAFFVERLSALLSAGVRRECICWDPGIGFGKSLEHNLELLARLEEVRVDGLPLLMGLSRKRFLGAVLDDASAGRGTVPTVAMSLYAGLHGAEIHRVHEVAPLRQALNLWRACDERRPTGGW